MKALFTLVLRLVRKVLVLTGIAAFLFIAVQFMPLPGYLCGGLGRITHPFPGPPTHILVMGGGSMPDASGLLRTFYAAWFANRHPEAEVLLALPAEARSAFARDYINELTQRGVDKARIHVLQPGRNTREQALGLAAYFADRTNASPRILIVTSPMHVRRTAACIRKICPAQLAAYPRIKHRSSWSRVPSFPAPAASTSTDHLLTWNAKELDDPADCSFVPDIGASLLIRYGVWDNLRSTIDCLREYAALAYYRLRGWI